MIEQYRKRRDLKRSGEPAGGRSRKKPIFVIQKHAASQLHYDFRLEVDGVLKSWSVPKGPSTNPKDRRLAVQTDDHPMDYASFEGMIPEGNYGAGAVIVWDAGTYENLKDKPMAECLEEGSTSFSLTGKKLHGGYALIRTKQDWLLVKMNDEHASAQRNPIVSEPASVLSGRTVEQVRSARRGS